LLGENSIARRKHATQVLTMQRKKLLVIVIAVLALVAASVLIAAPKHAPPTLPRKQCAPLTSPSRPAGPETLVTLCFSQKKALPNGGSVSFVAYDDRRCPSDVVCAWQGEAWGVMEVSVPSQGPKRVRLPWNGGAYAWRSPIAVGPYDLELRRLEPYPSQGMPVRPSSYSALVAVRLRSSSRP
jgi:hypothetical protein